MSSARAAQASGSPPGSLTTCSAIRAGRIRASPISSAKFSLSSAKAAISSVWTARAARAAGIRAEAFSGVSARLCRISARSLATRGEEHVADLGGIVRPHRERATPSATALRSLRLLRRRAGRRGGDRGCDRQRLGMRTPQPELVHDFGRRRRIDRQPRPHRRARRVVDLIDQAGRQFDELPLLVVGMRRWPAHRDRSARAARSGGYRRPRGARASSARRNPGIMELRSCQVYATWGILRVSLRAVL